MRFASHKEVDISNGKPVYEDGFYMCKRCGSRYGMRYDFRTDKLTKL
jgi:hypothetical protein